MRLSTVARQRLMVGVMAVFTASTVAAALAPSYGFLAASRLVCALAHGVFWAALVPLVGRLVGAERAGRSAAAVFIGISLATVLGVPMGTALGVTLGWRFGTTSRAAAWERHWSNPSLSMLGLLGSRSYSA